jgi:hypothetical protein
MISFAILAMGALVIDLGFVRLARFQMQSAVSSAALEGLRFRDDLPEYLFTAGSVLMTEIEAECGPRPDPPDIDSNPTYRAWLDRARRVATSRLVARVFDDDLDPADGDPLAYGAGPILDFSGGVALDGTDFRASQFISIPDPYVYKPALRSNLANDPVGDMVPGSYRNGIGIQHVEQSDYSRDDFDPASGASGFLVRARRTNEAFDPGSDNNSGGPALPFLFARGSLLALDNRAQGVSVRATAIAAAGRAKAVGHPDPPHSLSGATPFALRRSAWESATFGADVATPLTIALGSPDVLVNGTAVGHFIDLDAAPVTALGQDAVAVPATPAAIALLPTTGIAYVPVVAGGPLLDNRVIGFGFVNVSRDPADPTRVTLTKRVDRIAGANASAVLLGALPDVFSDQPNDPDLAALFDAHNGSGAFADPLLAPASMR